jgi:solute:Na+ symporter, SSS family
VPWRRTPATQEHLFLLTRWLTVFFGIVQIGVGIMAGMLTTDPKNTVVNNVLAIAGFSFGLLLGVFLLGVLTRRAGQAAALIGGAAGLIVLLVVKFVAPRFGLTIAFPWLAVIGAGTTFGAGWLISWLVPQHQGAAS